jgi:conjugal transfer ATP-binding protein TraC
VSVLLLTKIAKICGLEEGEHSCETNKNIDELIAGTENIEKYLGYRYFDEDNELFINSNNIIGSIIEICPIVGVDDGLYKNLRHFFNDELPSNYYVQFLLIASSDISNILGIWQKEANNSNEAIAKVRKKREEFILEQAARFKADGRIARDYRLYVNISLHEKQERQQEQLLEFRKQLFSKLKGLNLAPRICDAKELIKIVKELVYLELNEEQEQVSYNELEPLAKQCLATCHIQQLEANAIKQITTGLESRLYHIKELPSEFSLAETIALLGDGMREQMAINARFAISYTIASNISKGKEQAIIARGKRVISASQKLYSRGERNLQREAIEWQEVVDKASNGNRILTEHWQLMITASSKEIAEVEQSLISLYNIKNFKLASSSYIQLPVLLSILPMQQALMWKLLEHFRLTRVALAEEVIARLPIHAEWKGVPKSGVLLLARRGQIFNWNPFYKISSGNYNVCVFAPSGGGKSVFLQELAISMMAQNVRLFVLDIGLSFAKIAELLDGEMIKFGKEQAKISLNPFASLSMINSATQKDDREEFLKCTKSLLEVMCNVGDDARGSAELEKSIIKALEEKNDQLDITSFASFLEKSDSDLLRKYGATLYPYSKDGLYGKYFIGEGIATFKKLITVIEFEEIKNEPRLLAIVLQMLLIQITMQFLLGDRRTPFMIIVDEAWMLLDFAAAFFASFVRTVRKYGGSLVICVQNFTDLQKTQEHRTILENSTWTILLKQDEKGLGAFKQSEAFKDMLPLIRSISLSPNKYAELLIYTTGVSVIGRLVLDKYSKGLYSTDAEDVAFVKTRQQQGYSLMQALAELEQLKL